MRMLNFTCGLILSITTVASAAKAPVTFQFLKPDSIDVLSLIPDPPSENSTEHRDEMNLSLREQNDRTPDDVERVRSEEKLKPFAFATVLGNGFTAENCPITAKLLTQAARETGTFLTAAKHHWQRPRPLADPRIHALIDESEYSYPSGHSTAATLYGELLSAIYPEHRAALIERSQQIGWDRVIAGVHWQTDIYAGRVLGKASAKLLLANPEFKAQLERAKAEIDRAIAPVAAGAASR